jgi:hypothetical protein
MPTGSGFVGGTTTVAGVVRPATVVRGSAFRIVRRATVIGVVRTTVFRIVRTTAVVGIICAATIIGIVRAAAIVRACSTSAAIIRARRTTSVGVSSGIPPIVRAARPAVRIVGAGSSGPACSASTTVVSGTRCSWSLAASGRVLCWR